MNRYLLRTLLGVFVLSGTAATAQDADTSELKKLAFLKVDVTNSVRADARASGRLLALERTIESLNGQLFAAFQATGQFRVIPREASAALAEEDAATGRSFGFADSDLLLRLTVDDFQDRLRTQDFPNSVGTVSERTIRLAGVASIIDRETQVAVAPVVTHAVEEPLIEEHRGTATGDQRDSLFRELAKRLAVEIAWKVADQLYPPEVSSVHDKIVTIDRGDGSGIKEGQEWEVFRRSGERRNRATGRMVPQLIPVGRVKVSRVFETFSHATVIEDTGIAEGAIVRRATEQSSGDRP